MKEITAILIDPASRSMLPVSIPVTLTPGEGRDANDLDHDLVRQLLGFDTLQAIPFPYRATDWAYVDEENLVDDELSREFDCFEVGAYQGGYRLSSRTLVYGFDVMKHRYSTPTTTIEKLSGMITWMRCRLEGFSTKRTKYGIEVSADWRPLQQ
jgi:hypothetical protein